MKISKNILSILFCILIILFVFPYCLSANQNDTLNTKNSRITSQENAEQFTAEQDSVYNLDKELSLPFLFWIRKGFDISAPYWRLWLKSVDELPQNSLANSFAKMPAGVFLPLATEVVQYDINKTNALSVPTVFTFNPGHGINIDLQDIATFLGIIEDTSPEIKYSLAITADVEIVIYSVNAQIIATIFSGVQKPGKYTFMWNLKDSNGKKMSAGDYIAEVRIGTERFVRKRIVVK